MVDSTWSGKTDLSKVRFGVACCGAVGSAWAWSGVAWHGEIKEKAKGVEMIDPVILLAMVLQGEAGVVPQSFEMIANVVMNRVSSEWWPDDVVSVVEQENQFNGRAEPSSLALYYARRALRRGNTPTIGAFDDIFFVLSGDDVRTLGFPPGDIIYVNWNWSVHGYREWHQ